jgi:hypothetical protein
VVTSQSSTPAQQQRRAWLLFVHLLPPTPTALRVKTWRRLQQLGAIPVKQSVYVLPDSADTREDFEWLKAEIEGSGGEASVFAASSIDTWSDDELVESFRKSTHAAYLELTEEIRKSQQGIEAKAKKKGGRAPAVGRLFDGFRERFAALERTDFFGSTGRDRVAAALEQFEKRVTRPSGKAETMPAAKKKTTDFRKRTWVTRPRPGVDRLSSAWLIRRFIDADAKFGFVADRMAAPKNAIPFDMFGVEFSHVGDHCTFEMLIDTFGIRGAAVSRIASLVHDLDLKDNKFNAPDAPTVSVMIDGLQAMHSDDHALLEAGIQLFEGLFRAFSLHTRIGE